MKVLISDDEYHVIQAIRLLVPWSELGIDQVFTASGGSEALDIIQHEIPEIVITDIVMEDKSGLDIMGYIAAHYPSIKVIAVSGHNDFEYVRTMLTKGCLDYLLKPLEANTLIAAVQKAIQSWNEEHETNLRHRHMQEKMHSLSTSYSGVLLYKMLNPKNWQSHYRELVEASPTFSSVSACKIIYYDTSYFPMRDSGFSALLNDFEEQIRQLFQMHGGLMLSNPDRSSETILFLCESIELTATRIIKNARGIFSDTPYPFHIGISKEQVFPHLFLPAYHQAKNAFLNAYGDAASSSTVIPAASIEDRPVHPLDESQLRQLEDRILSALLVGSKQELDCTVSNWLACVLPQREIALYQIQYVLESFQRLFQQWFPYDCEGKTLIYEDLTDEQYLFSKMKMKQTILSVLYQASEGRKENRSSADIMYQIAQYMEINYTSPFVQSEYAKLFFLNKDYMSRKFTSTFGVNMLTYLNQIRIRHAKELLNDSSLKIQDIAYAVGFKDEKYFAKQFKKLTNVTPGDYRTSRKKKTPKTKNRDIE